MPPPAAPSTPTVAPVVKLLDPDGALVFRYTVHLHIIELQAR